MTLTEYIEKYNLSLEAHYNEARSDDMFFFDCSLSNSEQNRKFSFPFRMGIGHIDVYVRGGPVGGISSVQEPQRLKPLSEAKLQVNSDRQRINKMLLNCRTIDDLKRLVIHAEKAWMVSLYIHIKSPDLETVLECLQLDFSMEFIDHYEMCEEFGMTPSRETEAQFHQMLTQKALFIRAFGQGALSDLLEIDFYPEDDNEEFLS